MPRRLAARRPERFSPRRQAPIAEPRAQGPDELIADIQRNGNDGIGKPEPLKHGFQGYWSRRITDEHRPPSSSPNSMPLPAQEPQGNRYARHHQATPGSLLPRLKHPRA